MSRPLVPGLVAEGDTDEHFLGRVIARQLRALTDRSPRSVDVQGVQYGACRMIEDDYVKPRDAEKVADPKAVLRSVLCGIRHRKPGEHFAFAGDHVDLSVLAMLPAYAECLGETSKALRSQGFL
jgi:hypothetical protein